MILTDKQKIFMGLWHSGQLHWFCIPAFIVGSNPTSSTYFIKLFTNYLIRNILGSNLIAKDNEYEFFKEVEHSQTFLICKFRIRK